MKNIKNKMIENNIISKDIVSSFFMECLIFNVPDEYFCLNTKRNCLNIIKYLSNTDLSNFVKQDGHYKLFGSSSEQWSIDKANELIKKLNIYIYSGIDTISAPIP
ncbi:MAG: hypothetical protein WCJ19_02085 [bacterium]